MTKINALKLRLLLMAVLGSAPVLFLIGAGSYHLWDRGWSFVAYWPMIVSWLAAYGLAWYTTRGWRTAKSTTQAPASEWWTERDKQAWAVVEAEAQTVKPVDPDRFTELTFYAEQTENLALKVARIYFPKAADPFSHLTMPEVLACGELVTHDLTKLVGDYVPGSGMLTLGDLRQIGETVQGVNKYYPWVRNLYWAATAIINPASAINIAAQVAMAKGAMGPTQSRIKENVLVWLQAAFLRELGRHLIELNSGRLKVGAKRYLELIDQKISLPHEEKTPAEDPSPEAPLTQDNLSVSTIAVAVVGPVKVGQSILVNALLGESLAAVDIAPLTAGHKRYTLRRPDRPALTLIDTQGFGQEGATPEDVAIAVAAVGTADLVLLVLPARSAARAPEVEFLNGVRAGVAATPHFKMPPLVLALTQIDLIRPAMEWSPPYDFRGGTRPKEVYTREAVASVRELFGSKSAAVVPVCTAPGKIYGVDDELTAAIAERLGEARGVGFLRALYAEADLERTKKVFQQIGKLGGQALRLFWDQVRR